MCCGCFFGQSRRTCPQYHKLSSSRTRDTHLSHTTKVLCYKVRRKTMEHIVTTLGVEDLFLAGPASARKTVMKRARPGRRSPHSCNHTISNHRDSLLLFDKSSSKYHHDTDDDTMSTLSATSSNSSLGGANVTFAHPVVTAVHHRPRTTIQEKAKLYYQDAEYREFRHEYIYGHRQGKRVNFSASLVSEVWAYEVQDDKASLYYAQSDLQRYVTTCGKVQTTTYFRVRAKPSLLLLSRADFLTTLWSH